MKGQNYPCALLVAALHKAAPEISELLGDGFNLSCIPMDPFALRGSVIELQCQALWLYLQQHPKADELIAIVAQYLKKPTKGRRPVYATENNSMQIINFLKQKKDRYLTGSKSVLIDVETAPKFMAMLDDIRQNDTDKEAAISLNYLCPTLVDQTAWEGVKRHLRTLKHKSEHGVRAIYVTDEVFQQLSKVREVVGTDSMAATVGELCKRFNQ